MIATAAKFDVQVSITARQDRRVRAAVQPQLPQQPEDFPDRLYGS